MEFGEMKRNTSNWSNFCMLLRRAGLTALAGLSCYSVFAFDLCSAWVANKHLNYDSNYFSKHYFAWPWREFFRKNRMIWKCLLLLTFEGDERCAVIYANENYKFQFTG